MEKKKKSHRKEKQAFAGVWQRFPYMLSPWVRVHPVHRHILQACTNLWGKAVSEHSPVTWKAPRETKGNSRHPRKNHAGHNFPAFFPPGHPCAATFAQHFENFTWTRRQLPGVGPTRVWRSSNTSAEGAITATALSAALCILQGWDWETQACLSLRSDSD